MSSLSPSMLGPTQLPGADEDPVEGMGPLQIEHWTDGSEFEQ